MDSKKLREIARISLIVLILCTLAFIFTQSMLSQETSSAESDAVGDIIAEIIPPETPPGEYVQNNLRKIGHFVEFAILGAEIALYVILFLRRYLYAVCALVLSPIVALLDETIQIFSGRGPMIVDVWIDVMGFFSAFVAIYAIYFATKAIIKGRKLKKNG